jgi:uncharacterized membrane protein YbhN (UPF0104 family)
MADTAPVTAPAARGDAYARQLRRSVVALLIVIVAAAALVTSLPGLDDIQHEIEHASAGWLLAAIGLEYLSCIGYVLIVMLAFPRARTRPIARLAWAELAANAVLPAGGLGGLGLGVWILNRKGVPAERIAERSTVVFLLTSAANVAVLVLVGVALAIGLLPGTSGLALTLLPAAIGVAAIAATLAATRWAHRLATVTHRPRLAGAARSLAGGVHASITELRHPNWKLSGALAYLLFEIATLAATFAAIGEAPALATITMAFLLGQLAGIIPIPGGIGVVDGGLVGALALYGVALAPATSAVLLYRAISLLLPAILGTIAFVILRRTIDQPAILRPERD